MTKPAGKIVSLTELRFKPANSNDAARAGVAHHFAEVPDCVFARDDGISPYLGAETGMGAFPEALDVAAPGNADIPAIQGEAPEANGSLKRKLMRGGFALSAFVHAALAIAVGLLTLSIPDEAPLEEGITSVTLVTQGTADVNANLAGDKEAVDTLLDKPIEPVEKPVVAIDKPIAKPVTEEKPVEARAKPVEKPVETKAEQTSRDVPLPEPGANLPEILTSQNSKSETEAVEKPLPMEKKTETVAEPTTPVTAMKPVEEKAVEAKAAEKQPEQKPRPVKKQVEPVVVEKLVTDMPADLKPAEKQPEEKPKPVEKKVEEKKLPKKELPKKDKPHEKRRQDEGNHGNTTTIGTKGDVDAKDKGRASTSSKGASDNRDIGNSTKTNYLGLVNRKLSRAKGRIAAPANGTVRVTFIVLADGSISGLSVTKSSGKPALDAAAIKVVRNALPFPAIPADAGRRSWKMTVPMTFKGG